MTANSNRLGYPVNYNQDEQEDHKQDYLSQMRGDPNLHYFQDQLLQADSATAHRLAYAGNLVASDAQATAGRVEHIIDAIRTTREDEGLDEKDARQLAQQITEGMTAFHHRQREQLEFMRDHADYEVPKTPREQRLDSFENSLKAHNLEYVKNDSGDITVSFPSERVRNQILQNVPEGFARPVNRQENAEFKERLSEQRELQNTYIFKAQDDDEAAALQQQLLADEMDQRAKHRAKRIADLLEKGTNDPDGDDDDDGFDSDSSQVAHAIAELLHGQFDDDNKTMAERLAETPVPDPTADYNLDAINSFTDEDFRNKLIGMKVDYDFQHAREALMHHADRLDQTDVGAQAAQDATDHVALIYYNTLTKFADADDALKFAAYQGQSAEVGDALRERITDGASLLQDADFEMPNYQPPANPADVRNFPAYTDFSNQTQQALEDSDGVPAYLNLAANQTLTALQDHLVNYREYIDENDTSDPHQINSYNLQTKRSVELIQDTLQHTDVDVPTFPPLSSTANQSHLEQVTEFRLQLQDAIDNTPTLDPADRQNAEILIDTLDTQTIAYKDYLDNHYTADPLVVKELNRQSEEHIDQLRWLMKK